MKSSARVLITFFMSIVVFIAALYVLFSLDMAQWQDVQGMRYKVAERQAVRNRLMDLISQFREKVAQFTDLNSQIALITNTLPPSMNIPELLATMEAISAQTKVTLDQITFTSVSATQQTQQVAPAQTPGVKIGQSKALEVTMNLSGSGDYSAVKDFIASLETEQRLIDVRSLVVAPLPAVGGKTPLFTFKIDAKAYYITPPQFTLP